MKYLVRPTFPQTWLMLHQSRFCSPNRNFNFFKKFMLVHNAVSC